MADRVGIRAYARHRGVTPAAVRKAIRTGRITAEDGMIDPAKADQEWAANTDESKPRNSVSGTPADLLRHRRTVPRHGAPLRGVQVSSGGYATARAIRESFEARIRELDFKRMTGTLIAAEEARVAVYNMNRRARDLLLAIPDRIAAVVAGMTDAAEINKLLTEEFRRACDELVQLYRRDDPPAPR